MISRKNDVIGISTLTLHSPVSTVIIASFLVMLDVLLAWTNEIACFASSANQMCFCVLCSKHVSLPWHKYKSDFKTDQQLKLNLESSNKYKNQTYEEKIQKIEVKAEENITRITKEKQVKDTKSL